MAVKQNAFQLQPIGTPAGTNVFYVEEGSGAFRITLDEVAEYVADEVAGLSLPIAESDVTGLVSDLAAKAPLASPTFTGRSTVPARIAAITADTDGATVTFNCATSDWHTVTLAGDRTLALSNEATGQQFTIVLVQDGSGNHTVTWWSGIKWAGGSAPTLTTTAAKADVFTFKRTGSGAYYGFVAGQNL